MKWFKVFCIAGATLFLFVIGIVGITQSKEIYTVAENARVDYGSCQEHTFPDEYIVVKEATCQSTGTKYRVCTVCGAKDIVEIPVDPDNHLYVSSKWTTYPVPTCISGGEKYKICTSCNKKVEVTELPPDPEAHQADGDYIVLTDSTCQEPGEKAYRCKLCGEYFGNTPVDINPDNNKAVYKNNRTGIYYNHDFEPGDFAVTFPPIAEKYARRTNRMLEHLNNDKRVLLVFSELGQTGDKNEIIKIIDKINAKFNAKIDFLYINHNPDMRPGIYTKPKRISKNVIYCEYYYKTYPTETDAASRTLLKVVTPILLIALFVGLIIGIFQALTQIQEMTLAFVPKILCVFIMLIVLFPFMLNQMQMLSDMLFDKIVSGG